VIALPHVALGQTGREERPHDVENEAAAIDGQYVERRGEILSGNWQRHGHSHRGLPGADRAVRQKEDDDYERPRTHRSIERRGAVEPKVDGT
jgi:hypothetical protein